MRVTASASCLLVFEGPTVEVTLPLWGDENELFMDNETLTLTELLPLPLALRELPWLCEMFEVDEGVDVAVTLPEGDIVTLNVDIVGARDCDELRLPLRYGIPSHLMSLKGNSSAGSSWSATPSMKPSGYPIHLSLPSSRAHTSVTFTWSHCPQR